MTSDMRHGPRTPSSTRFSIVSAVHNVARYLPDFIGSIEKQTFALDRVDVVVVDDGSDDDSLAVLKDWAARRPELVTVLSQANAGQGAARNAGLEVARGEWVTFTDPDDILDPPYLARVDRFLREHTETDMIATNRVLLDDASGKITNRHALREMFRGKDQLVSLTKFPARFHGSAPAAFLNRAVLDREQIRFDSRIRPNFEDGHLCARYLLTQAEPQVGFMPSARYIYRKRADKTSTLQIGLRDRRRFLNVPRYGYLDIMRRATEQYGSVPEWLQNFVLYEVSFYFSQDIAMSGAHTALRGEVAEQFVELFAQIAEYFDPDIIETFNIRRFDREWAAILRYGLAGKAWHTPFVVANKYDAARREVRLVYQYVGEPPTEEILRRGQAVQPSAAKVRTHEYFEHALLRERIVWAPASATLRVLLNGRPVDIRRYWPAKTATLVRPAQMAGWFGVVPGVPTPTLRARSASVRDSMIIRLGASAAVRRRFRDAWVLMDRLHDADDNAERLFRYLRKHRRKANAWFVLERGVPDWDRLVADGYRRRLVAHGSLRWKLLMLNCEHLISSHADVQVDRPRDIMRLRKPNWRFTFLQHGVIKDDLSRWLNSKDLALFVTSTPGEYESIVRDDSPYVFTAKEVKLTGLPRFDRLRELASQVPPAQRDLILVCPTWRHWLTKPGVVTTHRQAVIDDFMDSEYVRQWLDFLRDERLRKVCEANNLRIGFLPHPNVQPALGAFDLPSHVEAIPFAGQDVQRLMARAAVMVTDFSSMAFNAAYIDRPVVYFQFDAERVLAGGHVGRRGYFDYADDGFGPVTTTVENAVAAVERAATADNRQPAPEYLARIDATFPMRDGRCCERVADAIADLTAGAPRPPTLRAKVRRRAGRYARAAKRRLARSS